LSVITPYKATALITDRSHASAVTTGPENCALLGYYAVSSGNLLPVRDQTYHYSMITQKSTVLIYSMTETSDHKYRIWPHG